MPSLQIEDLVRNFPENGLKLQLQHPQNVRDLLRIRRFKHVDLIDFDRLRLHAPEVVNDLPAGGKRLVQRAEGYAATLVAGTPVFEHGEHTGATPGRLVRRGR